MGIPASSSHTLIGAILGVGLANSVLTGQGIVSGVNWSKATEIGLSLLISPLIGFGLSAGLLLFLKRMVKSPELYQPPEGRPAAALVDPGDLAPDMHGSQRGPRFE